MLDNAVTRGAQLMEGLRSLQIRYPQLGDVRGLGLMIGCEFRTPEGKPDKGTAKAVAAACLERKMLLLTCGPWDNVIRWIPPLIVSTGEVEQALAIFTEALESVL
jgi:4-aminobutyrate aminotransferase